MKTAWAPRAPGDGRLRPAGGCHRDADQGGTDGPAVDRGPAAPARGPGRGSTALWAPPARTSCPAGGGSGDTVGSRPGTEADHREWLQPRRLAGRVPRAEAAFLEDRLPAFGAIGVPATGRRVPPPPAAARRWAPQGFGQMRLDRPGRPGDHQVLRRADPFRGGQSIRRAAARGEPSITSYNGRPARAGGPAAAGPPALEDTVRRIGGLVPPMRSVARYLGGNWEPGRLGGPGVRGAFAV